MQAFRLADLSLSHNCLQRTLRKDSNDSFNEVTQSKIPELRNSGILVLLNEEDKISELRSSKI